jgi:hypothetical protein
LNEIFNLSPSKKSTTEQDQGPNNEGCESDDSHSGKEFKKKRLEELEEELRKPEERKRISEYRQKHVMPRFVELMRKNSEADVVESEEEEHEYDLAREIMLNLEKNKYQQVYYIEVVQMNVFQKTWAYWDKYPYLELRKKLLFIKR